jgi:hypothetical protein
MLVIGSRHADTEEIGVPKICSHDVSLFPNPTKEMLCPDFFFSSVHFLVQYNRFMKVTHSSKMLRCVGWWKYTDISEVLTASFARKMIALLVTEMVRRCISTRPHGAMTQKTAIFRLTAVKI